MNSPKVEFTVVERTVRIQSVGSYGLSETDFL